MSQDPGPELARLRRETIADSLMTDQLAEVLELRVTALEEVVAARWPRSVWARRRLARDIRASVADVQGETFTARRIEASGSGWVRPLREC